MSKEPAKYGLSAEALQRLIVDGIEDFLNRRQLAMEIAPESLPFKRKDGYVVMTFLRKSLAAERGKGNRFHLVPSTDD